MIKCPLVQNQKIKEIECLENIDIADGMIKETSLPDRFKVEDWREICLNCPNHRED
ncbi:hypothetical protein [Chakrabartyella piscis]|uniref:hypothetical protein n=1 Tax=Chakrabartyella piscis TaxID=2918914 RepID=UPI002958554F|nr:hypothetical protein [Chakrabartyella piscis]